LRYITSKGGAVPKIENRFLVARLAAPPKNGSSITIAKKFLAKGVVGTEYQPFAVV